MPALEGAPRSRRASSLMGTAHGGRPSHSDDSTTRRAGLLDAMATSTSSRAMTATSSRTPSRCSSSRSRSRRDGTRARATRANAAGDDEDETRAREGRRAAFGPSTADARRVRDELSERSLTSAGWDDARGFLAKRASTALGRAACETLEPATTSREATRWLDETEAAMAMESAHGVSLDFGGMLTAEVRRGFFKTRQGSPLGGDELAATAAFLESARRLKSSIEGVTESGEVPRALEPLRRIVRDVMTHGELVEKIRGAVVETGEFRDNASQALRRARAQKGAAEGKLKKAMQGKGTPTMHQGRMVLAVAAPAPPDVLVVGTAAGGAMVLIEPPGIVTLNRELAQAVDAEKSAIDAIKRELSNDISLVVDELLECLDVVVRLDVVTAKCRYSQALNGVRPVFSKFTDDEGVFYDEHVFEDDDEDDQPTIEDDEAENEASDAMTPSNVREEERTQLLVELVGLRQPVLASQAIEAAAERRRAAAEEAEMKQEGNDGVRPTGGASTGYKVATRGSIKSASGKETDFYDELYNEEYDDECDDDDGTAPKLKGPVPVDIFASKKTKVVVITGPNTGGKTAAMKAVGLAALMAKSGIFIPAERAVVPFFDKVLVDIGDDQSLMTSLSTFSGRLTRAQAILEQCTPESLVLMDEVGTGTSPAEGAAIGYAMLKSLAGIVSGQLGACLTFATTHHGQLKALKYEYEEFENAAVEFDEADLRPTYKLLWGVPGRSSALQIATRYDLDGDVIDEARNLLGEGLISLDDTISKLETARRDADEDISAAIGMLDEIDSTIPRVEVTMGSINSIKEATEYSQAGAIMNMMREAKVRIADAARKEKQKNAVAPSKISAAAAGETDREREMRMAKEAAEQLKAEQEALAANWIPSPDEEVKINSTGMSGKVVSVDGSTVTVQAGRMQVKVNVDDISQGYTPSTTAPKMKIKKVRGASLAARRADDLLATSGRVSKPPPSSGAKNSFGEFELSDDDLRATVGDNVIVKKSGFKGKVIDDEDGLLTVQAGPNRVLAPAHTVEIVQAVKSQKTVSKKKKGKKGGFNLPNATKTEAPKPSAESSASSLAALQAKFGKKN